MGHPNFSCSFLRMTKGREPLPFKSVARLTEQQVPSTWVQFSTCSALAFTSGCCNVPVTVKAVGRRAAGHVDLTVEGDCAGERDRLLAAGQQAMSDFDGAVRDGGIGAPLIEVGKGLRGDGQRVVRGQAALGPVPAQSTRGERARSCASKPDILSWAEKLARPPPQRSSKILASALGAAFVTCTSIWYSGWSPDASTAPARCMVPFARWPFSERILIRFPLISIAPIASCTTSFPVDSAPIWTVPERSGHCAE